MAPAGLTDSVSHLPNPAFRTDGQGAAGAASKAVPSRISNLSSRSIGSLFKGREDFLEQLHCGFRKSCDGKPDTIASPQAIHGLGGIGKTRAAIEYAHRHKEEYNALLLVRADSANSLRTNLANLTSPLVLNLAERTSQEEEVRLGAVLRWLDTHPGWLLIIDNVDVKETAVTVEGLLEKLGSGHVLITSRLSGWSSQVRRLNLQVLDERDAVEFLIERSGRPHTDDEERSAKTLASKLDELPLALEQAGAYIDEGGITFAQYLKLYDAKRAEVLQWHDEQLMQYRAPVAVTWLTSFEQLSAPARSLLDSLAFMAPDPIPRSMIENGDDGSSRNKALVELRGYSLVRFLDEPPYTFSIHRLVQEIVRNLLGGTALEARKKAVGLLLSEVPKNSQDASTWNIWRRLAPHCAAVLSFAEPQDDFLSVIQLMNDYAVFLMLANAEHEVAEPFLRQALEARKQALGTEHPETLQSLDSLAMLLRTKGGPPAAETL
ncbi:MAG: motif domain protein [Verrucomicrobiales bacterium]|nr:motif domain protein [Verrucomicrobiales bacterium]